MECGCQLGRQHGDTIFSTTTAGSLGTQTHTYGEEGTNTVTVTVTDTARQSVGLRATFQVVVSDPKVRGHGRAGLRRGVQAPPGVTLATFTDPGGAEPNPSDPTDGIASHYKVDSIDWGDSTPLDTTSGTISYSGSPGSTTDPFTVSGSHSYAKEGTYTVTAIIDHEGVKTTVTTTATVKDKLGLLLLDPTGSQSLMVTGNGNVAVSGTSGAVVVDSNDATKAAFVTGNGAVTAGDFDVTGGVFTAGHGVVPSPVDHEAPTPDPLGLALPSPLPPAPVGNTATVLHPGTYVGGLHFSDKTRGHPDAGRLRDGGRRLLGHRPGLGHGQRGGDHQRPGRPQRHDQRQRQGGAEPLGPHHRARSRGWRCSRIRPLITRSASRVRRTSRSPGWSTPPRRR